jgi:DNA replication protein DnaC
MPLALGECVQSGQTRADLQEIIDDRSACKATIITSQLPIEHWNAWIGDAAIADAILDRIMQRNHCFTRTGYSLRPGLRQLRAQVIDLIGLRVETCPYKRLICWV